MYNKKFTVTTNSVPLNVIKIVFYRNHYIFVFISLARATTTSYPEVLSSRIGSQ